jgi:hypothetical protein
MSIKIIMTSFRTRENNPNISMKLLKNPNS